MIPLFIGIAWNVVMTTLFIVNPHPHLDTKRCYFDKAAFTRYCWPKHGCFYTSKEGDVLCWDVAKVKLR